MHLRAILLGLLFIPFFAHAQLDVFANNFTLSILGESAGPGDRVVLAVESSAFDTEGFLFAWSVNGEEVAREDGLSQYALTLGPAGTEARVSVRVYENTTEVAMLERTIGPALVDIVWEGSSYTHPFYKGRAFPAPGTTIKAQAIAVFPGPAQAPLSKNAIRYTWRYNERVVKSGLGADTYITDAPTFPEEGVLAVEALSDDGAFYAQHKVRIPTITPQYILYPVHPLTGVQFTEGYTRNLSVSDIEYSFVLYPFFAPIADLFDKGISLAWSVNGAPAESDTGQQFRTTLIAPQSGVRAQVKALISHLTQPLLNTELVWNIGFSDSASPDATDVFARPTQ